MSIGRDALRLLDVLEKSGRLADRTSIADLGSPVLNEKIWDLRGWVANAFPDIDHSGISTAADLYRALGFTRHAQIEASKLPAADRPRSRTALSKVSGFDVVTNFGTSANEIDQAAVFEACFTSCPCRAALATRCLPMIPRLC
jgi:hypothetical protein